MLTPGCQTNDEGSTWRKEVRVDGWMGGGILVDDVDCRDDIILLHSPLRGMQIRLMNGAALWYPKSVSMRIGGKDA